MMTVHLVVFVLFIVLLEVSGRPSDSGVFTLKLNGGDWTVNSGNGSYSVPAMVPGSVYTDLHTHGVLHTDPNFRFNDVIYRWVSYENWTYEKTFQVSSALLNHHVVQILCGGIDTIASLTINNQLAGRTNNMFRRYVFDIKQLLKVGSNTVKVSLTSPVEYARNQAALYPYPVPPSCPPPQQEGECYFNFIRKEASSFSWDWGPAFPTLGIWKNITLQAYNEFSMRYVTAETLLDDDNRWYIQGVVYFDVFGGVPNVPGTLKVTLEQGLAEQTLDDVIINSVKNFIQFTVQIPQTAEIRPWWPNGLGDQPLYILDVNFRCETSGTSDGRRVTLGFRQVELVQEPIPGSEGLTFYFKVNGWPVFMKGSNWIPADSFQEKINATYLRQLLQSAKEANMNMLRVWGGGVYESEEFYALADELGILIWQDFMFACAMYPSGDMFLNNVREEVTHQVRRLKHHASIALWAGNNENEWGLAPYKGNSSYERYYHDYMRLYRDTVAAVVQTEDPGRPFVPSSPSNGLLTLRQGWVADNPQDPRYGDIHHYDYFSDSWHWRVYPIPRFASEFGFQSWCSLETLRPVSDPQRDWRLDSEFTNHRQHHPGGNKQLVDEVSMHLKPPTSTNATQAFGDFVYLTQINQAVGIKTEAELYVRSQSSLRGNDGLTMGALYWQLNDIWQAPTWASIEYGGRWKMLHYYARRFFNQTLLSPYLDGDTVAVNYIHHRPSDTSDLKPRWRSMFRHGNKLNILQAPSTGRPSDSVLRFQRHDAHAYVTSVSDSGSPTMLMADDKLSGRGRDAGEKGGWFDTTGWRSQAEASVLTLTTKLFSWHSLTPKKIWKTQFKKPTTGSAEIFRGSLAAMLSEAGCPSSNHCVLFFSCSPGVAADPSNWLLLSNFTTARGLQKADIKILDHQLLDDVTAQLTLSTNHIAPFVWLQASGIPGRFSDNGMFMFESHMTLLFHAWQPIKDIVTFRDSLSVTSLMDVYE